MLIFELHHINISGDNLVFHRLLRLMTMPWLRCLCASYAVYADGLGNLLYGKKENMFAYLSI